MRTLSPGDSPISERRLRQAPTTEALLVGVYELALPALRDGLERHRRETHPVADQPTVRLLRFALLELEDLIGYGRAAVAAQRTDGVKKLLASFTAAAIRSAYSCT